MISVIIPVYNVERYLDKCLLSVSTNTYKDLEIICVNDGSTDGCLDILQNWREKDPRIVVVSHENRGLPEARNSGLNVATGEHTVFIDADDWVHPQFFEALLNCVEKNDADMVVCRVQAFEADEEVITEPISDFSYRKLTAKEFYLYKYSRRMIWGRLLRNRDTVRLRFPTEVDAHQDTLYNLRLVAGYEQPSVYMVEAPLYFYMQRPDSLHKKRSYEEMTAIADWYVKNERDLIRHENGEWSSLLLFHSISTVLDCRYKACLSHNRKLVKYSNALLRIMLIDIVRDKYVSFKDKMIRVVMILSPHLYSCFREINGTSIKAN